MTWSFLTPESHLLVTMSVVVLLATLALVVPTIVALRRRTSTDALAWADQVRRDPAAAWAVDRVLRAVDASCAAANVLFPGRGAHHDRDHRPHRRRLADDRPARAVDGDARRPHVVRPDVGAPGGAARGWRAGRVRDGRVVRHGPGRHRAGRPAPRGRDPRPPRRTGRPRGPAGPPGRAAADRPLGGRHHRARRRHGHPAGTAAVSVRDAIAAVTADATPGLLVVSRVPPARTAGNSPDCSNGRAAGGPASRWPRTRSPAGRSRRDATARTSPTSSARCSGPASAGRSRSTRPREPTRRSATTCRRRPDAGRRHRRRRRHG